MMVLVMMMMRMRMVRVTGPLGPGCVKMRQNTVRVLRFAAQLNNTSHH